LITIHILAKLHSHHFPGLLGRLQSKSAPLKQFRNYSQTNTTLKKLLVQCPKTFIISKTNTGPRRRNAWDRHGSGTELHEETWNAACYLYWQSMLDPCLIVFENCRCSWRSDL